MVKRSLKYLTGWMIMVAIAPLLSACENKPPPQTTTESTPESADTASKSDTVTPLDTALFNPEAMAQPPEMVACTLENDDTSDCAKFVVKYLPDSLEIGPFCPKTLQDVGGIWDWDGTDPGLYRVNEAFLRMLDKLGYTFFDEDGSVHIADIAVAEPVDDHACINVSPDEAVEMTVLLPATPVKADSPTPLGVVSKVGLALKGVPIFSDAPSIERTGHMPALDTCAGHIDPGGWYHFHGAASDIDTVFKAQNVDANCNLPQDSAALFSYAFDGFPIYGSTEQDGSTPKDLDACSGHEGPVGDNGAQSYHYHASKDFPNLPPCLVGVVAKENFTTTAQVGVGANPPEGADITRRDPPGGGRPREGRPENGPPGGSPPGFAEAAEKLGVSEEAFTQAMQDAGGPQADLSEVAKTLGVSEAELREALPPKPNR